jgi:hypothetical protein
MPDFVGISISGDQRVISKLSQLYPEYADAGTENANEYMVNSLRIYPPYSYVSVEQSGGWRSEKQRRFVMAAIRDGRIQIPYRRTQRFAQGWHTLGSGANQIVVNETEYGPFLVDDVLQSLGSNMRGWERLGGFIAGRIEEIIRRFEAGGRNAIKRLGLD